MKLSKYFLPVLKDISSDAKIKSHQLMLRIGMIRQSSAGIYSWLPLGYKILKKIELILIYLMILLKLNGKIIGIILLLKNILIKNYHGTIKLNFLNHIGIHFLEK